MAILEKVEIHGS